MGCKNPYALGNIALGCDCSYDIGSHGSLSATYDSMVNADLPQYAGKFYSQTEQEAISDIKYSKTDIGYDKHLRDIKRALEGAPIEAYLPQSVVVPEGGTPSGPLIVREPQVEVLPADNVIREIAEAQKQIKGKEIVLREIEFEEIIIKRRRIRKTEIRVR